MSIRAARLSLLILFCMGCGSETSEPRPSFSIDQLRDPESCKECHGTHYTEWSGSMHAYASYDPVFLAMNQRGQRETGGALGDFCVQCHAPMALRLGLTTDGLNLPDLPAEVQGITCYFCHSVDAVEGTHNNPLRLADDGVMRGGYRDPTPNTAHRSAYSPLLDRKDIRSADLCGSCHDIVNQAGVHLEQTFSEWKASLFAHETPGEQQTCGSCHTKGRDGVAADVEGVPLRRVHSHLMVGVDTALTPFPEMDSQAARIQRELNFTVSAQLCVRTVEGRHEIEVILENIGAGHSWPSGATQDRRAWVEVIAYGDDGDVVFESGVLSDEEPLVDLVDENLWRFGSQGYGDNDEPVHHFWEITRVESNLLPAPTENFVTKPGFIDVHRRRHYRYDGAPPAAVAMRVRVRAVGLDVLDDLIESGDLDASYRGLIPTYDLGFTRMEWSLEDNSECIPVDHMDRFGTNTRDD